MTDQIKTSQTADEAAPTEASKAPESTKAAIAPAGVEAEQLGDTGVKALKAERKARTDAEKRATDAAGQVADLTKRAVAAEMGLTPEQAALLSGETEEEVTAHANELLKAFAPKHVPRTPVERLKPGSVPGAEASQGLGEAAAEALRY